VKHAENSGCTEEEMDVEVQETSGVAERMDTDERVDVERFTSAAPAADASLADDATIAVLNTRKKLAYEGLRYSQQIMAGDGTEVLDVDGIIRKCIHPALVMLKDSEQSHQRATIRLELLLDLLHESSRQRFGT
jgi:hypothetical protein